MSVVYINPGSGPVADADERHAIANTQSFAADLEALGVQVLSASRDKASDCGDGRYCFQVRVQYKDGSQRTIKVQMPGLPLERVRYLGEVDQDIWDYPRLYIDDSSWVWKYALNVSVTPDDEA